jgi:drug/metabolite transporter (DMT)-like permease
MQFIQLLQGGMLRYWQLFVIFLMLNNLVTDILSRKHLGWLALLSGLINTVGWILLLGTKAPFARSITLYAISSYALTVVVASFFFGESFTRWQLLGIAFGGVAIVLLA